MGLKCLPNFAQETTENIFRDINDAEVYIDNIGALSPNWEHHLQLLHTILTKLQENGFTVNPLKCDWAVKESLARILVDTNRPEALKKNRCCP
jgi:hypothetical protein